MSAKKKPSVSTSFKMETQEATLEVKRRPDKLFIGVPKELNADEHRIPLTPESVELLVANGHEVVIQSKAGTGSHFYDVDYMEAGAEVVKDANSVYQADVIIKIFPPSDEELSMMKPGQTLISSLQLPTMNASFLAKLMQKRINAFSFEWIMDDTGMNFPLVRSMSEIAGSASVLIAAERLADTTQGKGVLLGGITGVPPAKVIILGAGAVGEAAARQAIGLGAEIKVFDNHLYKLRRLQNNVRQRIYTSVINPKLLLQELKTADVAIGCLHGSEGIAPVVVTEEMVKQMKAGSVIVDVSIDQGGCFETSSITTHAEPTFKIYDVIHYCVPNIASRVGRTASYAISNIFTPTLMQASEAGGFSELLWKHKGARAGLYMYNGNLTSKYLSARFGIKYTDLDLILAAKMDPR